jgi:NAD+ synthase (glutamine-hydrolysing)
MTDKPSKKRSRGEEADVKTDKKSKGDERVLPKELQQKLAEYRKKRNFQPKDWIAKKVELFNTYLRENGLKAAVISVSGGVDSAVTLGLLKRAHDAKDSPLKRILAVSQPIHSSAWAYDRAKETAEAFKVDFVKIDQTEIHKQLLNIIDTAVGIKGEGFATGQLRSYLRTPTGYYVAQLLSQSGTPCIVMGTGNKDEDGYLAYFCKAGDGVVDVQLIADIHKSEVFAVGKELGVPSNTLEAAPSADLWDGQTDEDELGFSYDFVELFTGAYLPLSKTEQDAFKASLSPEARATFEKWADAAEKVHKRNRHKIGGPKNINVY